MRNKIMCLVLGPAFALLHCGGKVESGPSSANNGTPSATAAGAGGVPSTNGCAEDPGPTACAGEGGVAGDADSPLAGYARLRTACSTNVTVNRAGPPVPISFCIH